MRSREQLQRAAADAGYSVETFEKVCKLMEVLEGIRAHPFLGTRVALKGGTALNLFVLDLPRLSVDIDLNYVGRADREEMLAERPRLEQALEQVFGRAGLTVRRIPDSHAGGKWRLSYTSALGRPGNIEVDLNYMLRTPLWSLRERDSHVLDGQGARRVLLLDDHELAAGKLAALVARSAGRDLFDARELLRPGTLDVRKLRMGFVVYGGMNREDWRTRSVDHVVARAAEVDAQLVPMLRSDVRPSRVELEKWTDTLVRETRTLMSCVLPLDGHELEFLERLNGHGEIVPSLLTGEPEIQDVLAKHPGLNWKAQNVKQHVAGSGRPLR